MNTRSLFPVAVLLALTPAARADDPSGAWLGITMETTAAGEVAVASVFAGSPAEAELRKGDVLLRAEGEALRAPAELSERLDRLDPGATLELAVRRGGEERTVQLVVSERPSIEEMVRRQHLGKPAPELSGVVGVGGAAAPQLRALRGKVVVLEFYAGWCSNCRALSPVLARWHARYKGRGLALVGVTNDAPEEAARVVRDWRIPYPVGCASADLPYAAVALPTTFLVDRKGVVRDVVIGRSAERLTALEKRLQQLLDERI